GKPVHEWELADSAELGDWSQSYQTVGQFMSTDLFTLRPNDLIDLAASVMDWRHIRHVPVEDDEGRLVGLVTHRGLLRVMNRGSLSRSEQPLTVREIMKANPTSVTSATPSLKAIEIMRVSKIGCLPVVDDGQLVGIVTSYDFLAATARIFKQHLGAAAMPAKVTNINARRAGASGGAA
ncbi:MAG TPA: CBS domain-containing protein, partial [Pyrinomonadaceae bacterium]|nr:CBS domain-containing protein [Pyrinomonadaceae bacterium]